MKFFLHLMLIFVLLPISNTIFAIQLTNNYVIVEPDMGRTPLLKSIKEAKSSIHLVIYIFKDKEIIQALIDAKHRGVEVNVLLQPKTITGKRANDYTAKILSKEKINVYWASPEFEVTHEKVLVIDERLAIIMGFNFDQDYFLSTRDFGIVTTNKSHIKAILKKMQQDEKYKFIPERLDQVKVKDFIIFGLINKMNSLFMPIAKLDNTNLDYLVWSPDNSLSAMVDLIRNSKKNLYLYTMSLSEHNIINQLELAAKRGVNVKVIVPAVIRPSQEHHITQISHYNIKIKYHTNYYIHSKVMIADAGLPTQKAFVGSVNLTHASLNQNRELGIITRDPKVVRRLNDIFMEDWKISSEVPLLIDTWERDHKKKMQK